MLLAFEIIKGYNRKGGMPRCMLHMDIQKAYDTMDWPAMKTILDEVGIPRKFTSWIMAAVKGSSTGCMESCSNTSSWTLWLGFKSHQVTLLLQFEPNSTLILVFN